MKRFGAELLSLILVLISGSGMAQNSTASLIKKVEGFSHPESVVLDEERQVLYVSNIGNEQKGDGFISKVSLDGEIIELKWITGLNVPKGLLIDGDKLYVTDSTELVEMSIEDGKINKRLPAEGAVSLNDITMDGGGNIFISDLGQSSIYWVPGRTTGPLLFTTTDPEGEVSEFLEDPKLNSPNGLLAYRDYIYVASWGENQDGNLLRFDVDIMHDVDINKITEEGIGNLDGVQPAGEEEHSFYVSDWATGKIHKMDRQGNTKEILTSAKSLGDFLYMENDKKFVLPMNLQNALWWYELN